MKHVSHIKKLNKDFFKSYNKILYIGLDSIAINIYCLMVSLPEDTDPSISWLARKLNKDRKTIRKQINILIKYNIISKRYDTKKVAYEFRPITSWKIPIDKSNNKG